MQFCVVLCVAAVKSIVNIAYIVGPFPVPSQTFVVNQIAGVAARGHGVDIFATERANQAPPAAIEFGSLARHTYSICPPRNYIYRLLSVLALLLAYGWRAPATTVRSLNVVRHGRLAATLWLLYAALSIVRLGARKYDIVHAQFGPYGLYALKLLEVGALEGVLVTSFRGYDTRKGMRGGSRKYGELFTKGQLFLPVSASLAGILIEAGCDPSKIRVLHSGIECAKFSYRELHPMSGQPLRVVTVGRLVEKKGVRYAIDAVARVVGTGRAIEYVIVGEGPLRGECERLIEQHGISAHVRLLGWKSHHDTVKIMEVSDILLAPSITAGDGDQEGIPNVIKEAMALGLPVISSLHAGIPELVQDGESGYLVPERSATEIAERIVYLWDHPELWPQLSRAARQKVEAEFDIGRLSDDLIALYETVAARSDNHAAQVARPTPVAADGAALAAAHEARGPQSAAEARGD